VQPLKASFRIFDFGKDGSHDVPPASFLNGGAGHHSGGTRRTILVLRIRERRFESRANILKRSLRTKLPTDQMVGLGHTRFRINDRSDSIENHPLDFHVDAPSFVRAD
jgi:hypothetical protein